MLFELHPFPCFCFKASSVFSDFLTPVTVPRVFGDFFLVELDTQPWFTGDMDVAVFNIRDVGDDIVLPRRRVNIHTHDFDIRYGCA